jgi:hypothetical protein
LWDVARRPRSATWQERLRWRGPASVVSGVAVSADGNTLAAASLDGTVDLLRARA